VVLVALVGQQAEIRPKTERLEILHQQVHLKVILVVTARQQPLLMMEMAAAAAVLLLPVMRERLELAVPGVTEEIGIV
jgi:hypothetical protein